MNRTQQITRLSELLADLNKIADNAQTYDQWELVYDRVFGESRTISKIIDDLGYRRIEYYDPDSSYEEDVKAYLSAANDHVDNIKRVEGLMS